MSELLLSVRGLSKAYGAKPLFEDLSFGLFEGDRVGLVGPNGAGKSTLLRLVAGLEPPDTGERAARRGLKSAYVPQDSVFEPGRTLRQVLEASFDDEHVTAAERAARLPVIAGRAGLGDLDRPVDVLSGGFRKRLAIACALLRHPDLLLMDEPTNHLDVEGVLWLQGLLASEAMAVVVVSHDRYFLETVASRMLELNRAFAEGLLDVRGSYTDLLEKKNEVLANQAAYQESLAGRVRQEIEWLRRKARARTRKAQARVDEAHRLIEELDESKARSARSTVGIAFDGTDRRTKELVVVRGLAKAFSDRPILAGLDLVLRPGVRLGLLGANGSGKTTLLRLLAGQERPDSGSVVHASGLRIVYFDQHRGPLDPGQSLKRALAPAGDNVIYQGRAVHVAGWASRFLFRTEQLEQPVGRLSGGEQARVRLAQLMLEPADLLLLDEPTNDLDIPTLEILEESLIEFPGALVLVTHDRYLLDRVSTQILALDGGGAAESFADYAQWEGARASVIASPRRGRSELAAPRERDTSPRRLSYKDKAEWEQMESRILAAESRVAACEAAANDPAVATDAAELQRRHLELATAQAEVESLYARWAELEAKQGS